MIRKTNNGTFVVSADELDIKHIYGREACSTCPLCRDSREHPEDPSMKVDINTGAGYCHHCHNRIFVPNYAKEVKLLPCVKTPVRDKGIADNVKPLDDVCRDYLKKRSIDPRVAEKAGVGSVVMHGAHYLAFPFVVNGTAVNVQFKRADAANKEFRFVSGGRIVPWNIDCLLNGDGTSPLYITEGMMDSLALIQSGYLNVISVPNGAGSKMDVFDDYRTVIKHNFSHIVFAGDTDKVGEELRDRVKMYFDDMDVSVVRWSWADYTCKDANDMLICGGTDAIAFCVENAKYNDCGYFDVMDSEDRELIDVYENGMPEGRGIGLKSMDKLVKFLPGYMYVISGYPGAGKSSMVNFITMSLLHMYGWRTLFFTPEKLPKTNHRIELLSLVTGKKYDRNVLRRDELQIAMNYLSGNVLEMKMDVERDIDVILRAAEIAVRRYGIKVLVIDPFLYIEIKNLNGMSETNKISQILCRVRMFAQKHKIIVIVVAHPRKPNMNAEHPRLTELLYEVAGSSGFFNYCDVGIMLERANVNNSTVKLKCGKSRFPYLGKVGETTLTYDSENGRYAECSQFGSPTAPDVSNWTDRLDFYKRKDASDYVCEEPF